jgi:trehalose 6-phosphate phosphatase
MSMRHLFSAEGQAALVATMARRPLLAFDFDGTLAPIVARPDDARVPTAVQQRLERLGRALPLAIVSGRRVDDVRARLSFTRGTSSATTGPRNPWSPEADSVSLLDGMRGPSRGGSGITACGRHHRGRQAPVDCAAYRLSSQPARALELVSGLAGTLPPGFGRSAAS